MSGPTFIDKCEGCGQFIDPDVCHCGDGMDDHTVSHNHAPIPMGCECHRAKPATRPCTGACGSESVLCGCHEEE